MRYSAVMRDSIMPPLSTDLPMEMREKIKERRPGEIYGLAWGNPDKHQQLIAIKERYLLPYVNADHACVEIGVGGGRWTQYMAGFNKVYAVDYHEEMFEELRQNIDMANVTCIKNNGTDFPGIEDASVDFVFSFGTFVHLDLPIITAYLENIRRIVKPTGTVFIQYSDKNKTVAQENKNFADNKPEIMIPLVESKGFEVIEQETELLKNASCVLCRPI